MNMHSMVDRLVQMNKPSREPELSLYLCIKLFKNIKVGSLAESVWRLSKGLVPQLRTQSVQSLRCFGLCTCVCFATGGKFSGRK